ncbi:ribulose-phosphate 3-epimerase [Aquibacillus salsiterrae]|uniref:Ribulose-phosphate 3-epimerase n=1 Tax=Aquibacillus salsiterrae TaxID=2950439 RepID=A0A9X4AFW2_9BACI|nr:ribulose-phosphate 3-epimerase [Aquibacillus salsiterrae]MDC3416438.1 ribulose-phosphate 3-epimerase [Aquibacillus salsiterrae]
MTKISPSILSADFANLKEEILDVERGGADYIHVDVMDGQFVPNITMGPLVVKAIRPVTKLPLDVHLMIKNPDKFIHEFVEVGADILTVHAEASPHLDRTIQTIKDAGIKAGVVINPATPVALIQHVLPNVDLVLLMTVNPGFGGQSFIHYVLNKVEEVDKLRKEQGLRFEIEVDGGVNADTAKLCKDAGVDVLVAGSAIFNQRDRAKAIASIRNG